jgi:hypothetical protein
MERSRPLRDWIARIQEDADRSPSLRAVVGSEDILHLTAILSCGACSGFVAHYRKRARRPDEDLIDPEDGWRGRWIPNGSARAIEEEVSGLVPASATFRAAEPVSASVKMADKALDESIATFRHRTFRGLPNIHLDHDAGSPAPGILKQMTLRSQPPKAFQSLFESILYAWLHWNNTLTGADTLIFHVRRPDTGYVQFSRLITNPFIYGESTSKLFKEKKAVAYAPDHSSTAKMLGWRNDDRLPNDFGVYQVSHRREVVGLAELTLHSLLLLHGLAQAERLKITILESQSGWSQDTVLQVRTG